jgi:hypothetical protein
MLQYTLNRRKYTVTPKSLAEPSHQREQHTPEGVAQSDHDETEQCMGVPHSRDGKIIHVRDTVFCPAQDKYGHAEKERKIFTELVGVLVVAFDTDIDQNVTEDSQDIKAQKSVV